MLRRRWTFTWRWASCAGLLVGCLGTPESADPIPDAPFEPLPVVALIEGEYDGHELTFRTLDRDEAEERGVAREALIDIPSRSCTTATCTDANYVAFSNVAGGRATSTNGATVGTWAPAQCGAAPASPTSGVCQQVRLRNLYSTQIERAYAELLSLTPTGSTTSVSVPAQPFAALADFSLAPTVPNGLWRFGEIGRDGTATTSPTTRWVFHGTTPAGTELTFRFVVQVRGQLVSPTRRASVVGNDDPAADYPARTTGATVGPSSIDVSADGRYVVFTTSSTALHGQASGQYVVRHDMTTGESYVVERIDGTETIATGCTSSNPSISDDGNRIAFESSGCDLVGLGATTTTQVYVRDVSAGTTTLASADTGGEYANQAATSPQLSGNGQVVVFQSRAFDLVSGTPALELFGIPLFRFCIDVYRRDLSAGTTTHVSARPGTAPNAVAGFAPYDATNAGEVPDVSADGSRIVFRGSWASLVTGDTNGASDVYVYAHGGATVNVYRVSLRHNNMQLAGGSDHPSISADGAFVAFSSLARNVSTGAQTAVGARHVYRRSSANGASASQSVRRVTLTPTDANATGTSFDAPWPALSRNGRFVSFWSSYTNLASTTTFPVAGTQHYVCDMGATATELQRCFVASTFQATPESAFAVLGGASVGGGRSAMACADEEESCYVAYQTNGAGWTPVATADLQVFVSPVGDPRAQMPAAAR
ncbi:TolB family protein [Sandaracinus amylolyticus]|uniref:TolB family protein n=1 Tax=Sandaracinus amylolyticus TaxID=927083 RepID=UPI001F15D3CC|nr:hypothetical protein [Sandaracinus amylolyticus]UJR80438.1 Hypothetical protein I5071_24850 [Sandaracinus amylolyticus]